MSFTLGLVLMLILLQIVLVGVLLWRFDRFESAEEERVKRITAQYSYLEQRVYLLERQVFHGRG